jgi:uncharacterized protein YaaR (DUF327 family)
MIPETAHKKSPSHTLLQEYKKAVKDFLQVVVSSAFEVAQKEGRLKKDFTRNKYTQINLINARLDKLAASVLQGQTGALSLLEKVEELNGFWWIWCGKEPPLGFTEKCR